MGRDDLLWVFGLLLSNSLCLISGFKMGSKHCFPEESCNDGMTCMISLILVPQKKSFIASTGKYVGSSKL